MKRSVLSTLALLTFFRKLKLKTGLLLLSSTLFQACDNPKNQSKENGKDIKINPDSSQTTCYADIQEPDSLETIEKSNIRLKDTAQAKISNTELETIRPSCYAPINNIHE